MASVISDRPVRTDERPRVSVVVQRHLEHSKHAGNASLRTGNRVAEWVTAGAASSHNKLPDPRTRCGVTARREWRESLVVVFVPVEDDVHPLSEQQSPQVGHALVGCMVGA